MASVTLERVTKRWGDFVGVDDQSLEIADREFLVLLGPSGCGKTTTMRMIAGLEEPTSGEIRIGSRRVNDDLPKDRDIAMVFQNYGLYPHMTVRGNIAYPLKVRGVPKGEIDPRVEAAAEQVELGALLDRKPRALSGGQRQRVALARAIVRTPKVFLMDEPLSNLDAKLRVSMRAELKNLSHRLQVTTVYVTHDQIEAMTLADRVAVMENGRIQQLGTPETIYNDPETLFVAAFIGSPAMNLLHGSVADGVFALDAAGGGRGGDDGGARGADGVDGGGAGGTADGGAGARLVLPPTAPVRDHPRAVLGIRPEDIGVVEAGGGDLDAPVFAVENTGDSVLVTVRLGAQRLIARGDRYLRREIDERVGLALDPEHLYLFDAESGRRLR